MMFTSPAAAQDDETRNAARQMARDALELMNAENYAGAEDLLRRAYDLVPAPTVAVLRGQALDKLDRLVEAVESYEAARRTPLTQDSPEAFRDAVKEASQALERLRPEVPMVTIQVGGVEIDTEGLEVRLDDKPVPPELLEVRRPVDPGQHIIVVALHDTVHDTRWIKLRRGERVKVLMRVDAPQDALPPPSPPEPEPEPTGAWREIGWVALGTGGVGFVVGATSGVVMLMNKRKLDDACRPDCPSELEPNLVAFRRSRTVSALGYGVGFLGAGVGVLALTATKRDHQKTRGKDAPAESARCELRLGVGSITLTGTMP